MDVIRLLGDPGAIVVYLQKIDALGPFILFLLLFAQVFIALLPGHALVVASGYVYGAPSTIAVVSSSTILASQLAFWLARSRGRSLIYKLASPSTIERWNKVAGNRGAFFFFFTFVTPIFPADLMCYVAGLGKISPKRFFIANFCGRLLATIVMTLIGAYKFHPPFTFWILVSGSLAILLLIWKFYYNPRSRFTNRMETAQAAGNLISTAYRRSLRIQYDIEGLDQLPSGPKIFAANHPTASDTMLLPPVFGEPVIGLAEAGQFQNPIIGWILTCSGHIPVDHTNPHRAFEQSLSRLSEGKNILIFPEGTLNPDYEPMRARIGAVRLSLKTGIPVIPIGIYVNRKDTLNLRWYIRGRGHGGCFQFREKYIVRIGNTWIPRAYPGDELRANQIHDLSRSLMDHIYSLVREAGLASTTVWTPKVTYREFLEI